MAISRVQYTGNYADDTTAVTCASTSDLTAGNLLVIYAIKYSPSSDPFVIGDISKSAGACTLGTFTLDVDNEYGTYASAAVYSVPITGSGSCTIQVTGVSGSWFLLALEELSSADVSASRLEDTSESGGFNGSATSGDATSAAGAIFCGCMADLQAGATTHDEDAAFTLIYEQSTASHMTGSAASQIVTSGTTDAATWTMGVSAPWVAVLAVYKEAASSGTNITPGEATQAQLSDAVSIVAISPIVPAEATQAQLSDAATLSEYQPGEETQIAPAEALQAQISDVPTMTIYLPVANTGEKYPGSNSTTATAPYDDINWTSWANIAADDTSYASLTSPSFDTGIQSYLGNAYNFNAGIPSGGSVVGYLVAVGKYYANGAVRDAMVSLINGPGTLIGSNKGSLATTWPTTAPGTINYGGEADNWGTALTTALVNSTAFGIGFAGSAAALNADAYVDFIRLTVYYNPPPNVQFQPHEATQAQLSDAAEISFDAGTPVITATDATQAQTSDAASIVAITPITPEEATQAQASDAAVVTLAPQQWEITPAEATQAQASDAAGLIYLVTGYGAYIQGISDRAPVYYLIATAEGAQAQASDAAVLSGATPSIAPAEATQAQASDAASITAISPITPAEALQAQASDAASLTAIYLLTPAEATQSQISDAATLGQFTPIDPAEATQAQASDAATIVAISPVTPAEAAQAQSSDAVTLTAIYPVTSAEATQTQISDAASIAFYAPGESIPITPAEALQAQTSDAVTITAIYPLAPSEATQSQTSDAATITAVYPVTVSEATQTQISDAVSLTYYEPLYSIVPEDATQAQLSDAVTLAVVYVLTVADATQAQISDLAVLTSPITAYPPGQRRLHTLDTRGESELAVRGNSVFATRTTLEVDD